MEYKNIIGKRVLQILLWILLHSTVLARSDACDNGLCAPAYGNLLIGRENRLTASSTCGLRNQEKFCVITNFEGQKNCFWCDSHNKNRIDRYHGIENVVSFNQRGQRPWWQSQNGVENVTIRLDLETVFYFSYLYMKFKTFRPAAMLVERSADYGETWQPYGYFAADCSKSFPNVPQGEPRNLTVPYCTQKYSASTPLEGGEVIFRALPSYEENTIDPFSKEIQNLVKFTNLRVNFTKLHTLGDDLLDSRTDIKEKYYYAVYEMIVSGTCACYGHADHCLADENVPYKVKDMVHGKCACTHNTAGLNCQKCKDLYNDLEWAPAFGKLKNECKKCNCNNHATRCHFDPKVFELTGQVSGGVCDDCQHNTTGRNCEQCKHFFYHDPNRDFTDPYVCLPCDCDPDGSLDDGICDSVTDPANNFVSGQCHCKPNVDGRRCDTCKNGFWNLTKSDPNGCIPCSCNILGTHDNQGCNKDTGECTCKRNVIGRDCNQCVPKHWGLGQSPGGCEPCNCDPGGSVNDYCDVITGQCKCLPNLTGRTCNTTLQSYYIKPLDYEISEAELDAKCSGTCTIEIRAPYPDYGRRWTGPGFERVGPGTTLDFPIQPVAVNADFNVVIRYEPQVPNKYTNAQVILIRPDEVNPNGYCGGKIVNNDVREVILRPDTVQAVVHPQFCLEAHKNYTVRLQFLNEGGQTTPAATILIDSILMAPHIESVPFMQGTPLGERRLQDFYDNRCGNVMYTVLQVNLSDICRAYHYSIGAYIYGGGYACECDSTGSYSSICDQVGGECKCKPNVIGRKCNYCAPGTYGFGPEGCKACDCHSSGALDNFCDVYTGQCKCRPQTYGRSCDQCQPGSWNYPNCQRCICHGHADICDPRTGICIDCKNSTEGSHCDRCQKGYYGDPRIGVDIPCRKCPCPGTSESGHSFADSCTLDPRTQDVICECWEGYSGARCELCSENYFGNPEVTGGKCSPCNCSNNIDITRPGNCDPTSGKCLRCLYNTDGFSCEYCRDGFYGDALQQSCRQCVCDLLGTDQKRGPCDKFSGQCPCLPNVTGISCDTCIANHWKIASGAGCEPCACDPNGSESEQCNQFDGQCACKSGFGGRRCDQCQTNYWGDPTQQKCHYCECNPEGSARLQCNQTTGDCACKVGIGGAKCNQCARGYLGQMPNCSPCGECFDNWDAILNDLKDQTKKVAEKATEIIKTGTPGSYEFEPLEKKLAEVKQHLQNTSASSLQLQELEKRIASIRAGILSSEQMNDVRAQAENVTQRIKLSSVGLDDLRVKVGVLNETAENLKNNATKLQEGNVEGALNLTREAYSRANQTREKNKMSAGIVMDAQKNCKRAENFITRLRTEFSQGLEENDNNLQKLTDVLNEIEGHIPNLNQQLCDKGGNPCDQLCGGAGCGFCGGISCDEGALNKADNALKFAKEAEKEMKEKETKVGELFRGVSQARSEAKNALNASEVAHFKAEVANNESALALNHTADMIERLEKFINTSNSTPAAIRQRATDTLLKTIQLQPEKITELAQKINETVSSLTNIDAIIKDTEADLQNAKTQKANAESISAKAKNVLNVTENVLLILGQAEVSQKLADSAIQNATSDIGLARKDLSQISETSTKAQQTINDTVTQFMSLEDQFKKLQNDFLKNTADAMNVESELNSVANNVSEVKMKTESVVQLYKSTAEELDSKASNSTSALTNAQQLSEKASRLLQNAREKTTELEDLDKQFIELDKDLHATEMVTQDLMKKMNAVFDDIKKKSEYYQAC